MTSVKTNKKGFTLVELVVVIAILAILAAIAIPVVNSVINTATKNGALTNASSIELAIKNAQADIASKNYETFSKTEMGSGGTGITIAKVADKKGLKDAFDTVNYKGDTYDYYWALNDQKVYVLKSSDKKRIDTGDALPATAGTLTKLTAAGTETVVALSKSGTAAAAT